MYFLLQIAVAKQVPYSTYHEEIRNTRNTNRKNICFQTRYGNSALSATSSAGTQIEDNNKSNIGIVNMGGHFWKSRPLGSFVFCHLKYECFFLAAGPLLRMHVSTLQNVHSFHVTFLLHKSSIHKLFGVHFKPKHSGNAEELPLALTWIEITQQDHITWHVLSKPLCFLVTSSTRKSNSRGQNHCALQTQNSKWTCDLQHHDRANNIILHLQKKHAQKKNEPSLVATSHSIRKQWVT